MREIEFMLRPTSTAINESTACLFVRHIRSLPGASNDQSESARTRRQRRLGRPIRQRRHVRRLKRDVHKLRNTPDVIGYAERHRGRAAQGLMNPAQVVEVYPQRDGSAMIRERFALRDGQVREPLHLHTTRQIDTLDIRRGYFRFVGPASYDSPIAARDAAGAASDAADDARDGGWRHGKALVA